MQRDGTHPMARINYAIRAGSFAYSFLVLSIHGWEHGFGPLFWTAAVLQFLLYPHLAYLHTLRAENSRRAESINLVADAGLLGLWVGALHFPLWIAYGGLFSTALNAAVVFGTVRGAWSIATYCVGAAVGLAFGGYQFLEATSPMVTALCFLGSLGYAVAVGGVMKGLRGRARDSEGRYRLLAENVADLIAIVDREGRWIYTSPSFDAVMPAKERAEGADAFDRAHPDDADRARVAVVRSVATGKAREMSMRLMDREGRLRQYRTRVQPVGQDEGDGKVKALVLVSQDVTDLLESEERLLLAAHALEGMTEAIMITSADGTVVTVNRAFTEITGYAREDVLGNPEKTIRNALQPPEFYDELYAAVQKDGYWSGTTWARRRNGSVYREWRSVRAVRDAAGAATHYVMVFCEVGSEKSRLEEPAKA